VSETIPLRSAVSHIEQTCIVVVLTLIPSTTSLGPPSMTVRRALFWFRAACLSFRLVGESSGTTLASEFCPGRINHSITNLPNGI
jgi:hypothetical protein